MSPKETFGPIEEKIRVEAADWFARMRGPDAAASRAQFQAWYATPAHAHAYEQMVARWEQSAFIGASSTSRHRRLRRASLVARHPALSAAAALIAIVACTALIYENRGPRSGPETAALASPARYASTGEIREIALGDGSRVTLDKASLVLVSYAPGRRTLLLERGRARFHPARDAARPFVVRVGTSKISADGALFDVAFEGTAATVTALDGSVTVRPRAAPARLLLASQQIVLPEHGAPSAPVRTPTGAAAWLPHMITFDHTSLADAALQVGRNVPTRILFTDDASALQITGTFRSGDLDGLARAAQAMFHLKRSRDPAGNIVLSR